MQGAAGAGGSCTEEAAFKLDTKAHSQAGGPAPGRAGVWERAQRAWGSSVVGGDAGQGASPDRSSSNVRPKAVIQGSVQKAADSHAGLGAEKRHEQVWELALATVSGGSERQRLGEGRSSWRTSQRSRREGGPEPRRGGGRERRRPGLLSSSVALQPRRPFCVSHTPSLVPPQDLGSSYSAWNAWAPRSSRVGLTPVPSWPSLS